MTVHFGVGGSSVRAAQRTLEVKGPGFQGGFDLGIVLAIAAYVAIALVYRSQIRRAFGDKKLAAARSTAAPIGYTDAGEPIYPQVGYTAHGRPVFGNQVQGPIARPGPTNTLAIVALILGVVGG